MTDPVQRWLEALDVKHLADFTPSEVTRALRALSSCYVERREKLATGGALDSAGKRAAFALFYAPLHFLVMREVARVVPGATVPLREILDLGCGTGSAGAAWALETGARISGIDRNPWAVAEANWTYKQLGVGGRALQGDVARVTIKTGPRMGILLAYTVNELPEHVRSSLLPKLADAHARGASVLVVEPIARRMSGWWEEWAQHFEQMGGRQDEWRFRVPLPARQQALAKAAGLRPTELTARTLAAIRHG